MILYHIISSCLLAKYAATVPPLIKTFIILIYLSLVVAELMQKHFPNTAMIMFVVSQILALLCMHVYACTAPQVRENRKLNENGRNQHQLLL